MSRTDTSGGITAQVRHYGRILFKWKWTALIFFIVVVSGATAYSFLQTPIYTAGGSVWVEDESNILPFEEVRTIGSSITLQSHARLLQSRALAGEVIDKLKLYENPDFAGQPAEGEAPPDPSNPVFRERLIEGFLMSLAVSPVEGTRLVDVRFSHPNPKLAAEILNTLFDSYIDMLVRKRLVASEQVTEILNKQIETLRTEIDEREKKLGELGSEKDILPLTAAETPVVSRLSEYNRALTAATIDRINKFNYLNQLKSAPLGEIPDSPAGSVMQGLRAQYMALSREYSKRLVTIRPEYPEMQRLKSELDAATEGLQNETRNLIRVAETDYQAALTKERSLQGMLDVQKTEAYKVSSNSVLYNFLKGELESKKIIVDALAKRQNETTISSQLKGLESINVWIADRAEPPLNPSTSGKRKIILLGLIAGLAGGLGLAFGIEYLNQTVKTSKDVLAATGFPTLGVVPSFGAETKSKGPASEITKLVNILRGGGVRAKMKNPERRRGEGLVLIRVAPHTIPAENEDEVDSIQLIAARRRASIQAESYRSIRTTLTVSYPMGKIKTILCTSPLAREGKSSTVSNLGITLAQGNTRVIIVDSDLRRPKQGRIFDMNSGPGLTQYLSSRVDLKEVIKPTQFQNLFLINSGPHPANPVELLSSDKTGELIDFLKQSFDYILFDTPPLLAVSDTLALGPKIDGIILVVRCGYTPIQALKQSKQRLEAHNLQCLGVILNGVNLVEQDGYYAREYYHYSQPD
jgi:capsular exopolysaccharide synthesis family protein